MNSVLPSAAEGQLNGVGSRFGLRRLDAAFVLRQLCILHVSCWMSGEKERHSQSGVKPPHSKKGTGGRHSSQAAERTVRRPGRATP
jgi:hypothetical protein